MMTLLEGNGRTLFFFNTNETTLVARDRTITDWSRVINFMF